MAQAVRVNPQEVRDKVKSGKALLVCAYDDEEKCRQYPLEGAITLTELRSRAPAKDQELIFYCA